MVFKQMDKPLLEDAVAIVPISNMEQTLDFYKNVLCFESQEVSDDNIFATVKHEGAAIHLIQGDDEAALTATRNNISIYIWTKKLDELYATLEPGLSKLPLERVRAPFEQPDGMREFHVKDPDGCLLMFGEAIE